MFEPIFLGMARLAQTTPPYPVNYPDAYGAYNDLRQEYVDAVERGDEEMARFYEHQGEELREAYNIPLQFKERLPLPTPPPPPDPSGWTWDATRRVWTRRTKDGNYVTKPKPVASNDPQDRPYPSPAAGDIPRPQPPYEKAALPCPEGQYRPEGGGWCVPKPVATGYQGLRTVPYGSVFGGGFFGGGQGVSAGSFM